MKKILILAAVVMFCASASAQVLKSSTMVVERKQSHSRYQGELNFGYGLGGKMSSNGMSVDAGYERVFVETVHGMRIMPYLFAGVGVGMHYGYNAETIAVPVFLDVKGYYPVTDKFAPYIALDFGYSPMVSGDVDGGAYVSYGLGLNYGKLNFGLGWQYQGVHMDYSTVSYKASINSFFLKVGVKF